MFIKREDKNDYLLTDGNTKNVSNCLNPGVYDMTVKIGFNTTILFKKNEMYRKGSTIENGVHKEIKEYFDDFMSKEMDEARNEMDMLTKVGLIFTGDPGTGKTFLAGQIAQRLCEEKKAISIIGTNNYSILKMHALIDDIREEDNDRWIILILDEFEKVMNNFEDTNFLSFLDGSNSRKNVITIAIVNSTKKLPDFLIKRPGRFEKIFNFKTEDTNTLNGIIETIIPNKFKSKITKETVINELKSNKARLGESQIPITVDSIRLKIRDKITELIRKEKNKFVPKVQIALA